MRTSCFGENVKPIWTSVRISFKKRKYRFLAHVRLQRSEKHLHAEGNSLWCCSSYTEANLKGNQINMLLFWQKLQIRFCLDLSHYTINQHPSFLLLSLSTPLRLHLSSRPRASPSFIFLCHSLPSVRLSLTVSGDGGLCSLHLIWHFLHYCDQTDSRAKSCRFTPPLAAGSAGVRGWLHLQTSGYNGLVHLTS